MSSKFERAYAWFVRGKEHAAMCATSIAAVRKVDPEGRCIVVHENTNKRDWEIDALHLTCDAGQPIMLANLEAQVNALNYAHCHDAKSITFLDTDTILLRPFEHYGVVNFTWRDSIGTDDKDEKVEGIAARMPYNYGVIQARPSLSSLECFIWMRERIRRMHASHQQWYGNQMAAVELAGARPKTTEPTAVMRYIPWTLTSAGKAVTIGQLPCELYNYTPQRAAEDVSGKYVLHFKGRRRSLMKIYARAMGLPWTLPDEPAADLAMVNAL